MKNKFTPGPWSRYHNPVTTDLNCWVSNGSFSVATLPDPRWRSTGASEKETIANSYLIAAAPEMFELLLECHEGLIKTGFTGTLSDRVFAIIKKARGEL